MRVRRAEPARKSLGQHLRLHGLPYAVVHAGCEAPVSILLPDIRRHRNDSHMARCHGREVSGSRIGHRLPLACRLSSSDFLRRFKSVHFRHVDVHQDCGVGDAGQCFDGLQTVGHKVSLIAQLFQHAYDDLLADDIIIDD